MASKAKKNIMKRFSGVVASHIKDAVETTMNEAAENAETNHDVQMEKNWSPANVKKKLLDYNRKLKDDMKLSKAEFHACVKEGVAQAKAAITNNKENLHSNEDEFFDKYLDDFEEVDEDELAKELSQEVGEESFAMDIVGKFYGMESGFSEEENTTSVVVAQVSLDEIRALSFSLFLSYCEERYPEASERIKENASAYQALLVSPSANTAEVDSIDTTSNTVLPAMVQNILDRTTDLDGKLGLEEDSLVEETVEICEVPQLSTSDLCINPELLVDNPGEDKLPHLKALARIGQTASTVMQSIENATVLDPSRNAIVVTVKEQIDLLARYYQSLTKEDIDLGALYSSENFMYPSFAVVVMAQLSMLTEKEVSLIDRTTLLLQKIMESSSEEIETLLKKINI